MMFFALIAALGSIAAALTLILGISSANGAPQEAAAAAISLGFAVIPYVFFRAVQLTSQAHSDREFKREVLQALKDMKPVASEVVAPAPVAQAKPSKAPTVVREGGMGAAGWTYQARDDGSVVVKDSHGGLHTYASMEAARKEISWWKAP